MQSEKISERFRQYREREGLTQKELGILLGVESNYIYKVESGKRQPARPLKKLFDALDFQGRKESTVADAASADNSMDGSPPHEIPHNRLMEVDARHFYGAGSKSPPPTELLYSDVLIWIRFLYDRQPEAFRSVAVMIKGLYDSFKK